MNSLFLDIKNGIAYNDDYVKKKKLTPLEIMQIKDIKEYIDDINKFNELDELIDGKMEDVDDTKSKKDNSIDKLKNGMDSNGESDLEYDNSKYDDNNVLLSKGKLNKNKVKKIKRKIDSSSSSEDDLSDDSIGDFNVDFDEENSLFRSLEKKDQKLFKKIKKSEKLKKLLE